MSKVNFTLCAGLIGFEYNHGYDLSCLKIRRIVQNLIIYGVDFKA